MGDEAKKLDYEAFLEAFGGDSSPWEQAINNASYSEYRNFDKPGRSQEQIFREELDEQRRQVRQLQALLASKEQAEKKATAAMRRFVKYCMALIRRSSHTDLCPASKTLTGDCDCGLARVTAELSTEASHIVFEAMERQSAENSKAAATASSIVGKGI